MQMKALNYIWVDYIVGGLLGDCANVQLLRIVEQKPEEEVILHLS